MGREQPRFLFHELFEEQARAVPQAIALFEGDRAITYADLESRANRAAEGLRARGIEQGCMDTPPLLISHTKLYPYVIGTDNGAATTFRGYIFYNYVDIEGALAVEALEAFR